MKGADETTGVLRIAPHLIWQDVDADLVLFNTETEAYTMLDGPGSSVWRAIARHGRLSDVLTVLADHYGTNHRNLEQDVLAFVDEAMRLGLLTMAGPETS